MKAKIRNERPPHGRSEGGRGAQWSVPPKEGGDGAGPARRPRPRPRVSAVVPCFNEEESLPALYERLSAACHRAVGDDYEIVLVNDGSRDATWPIIAGLARHDRRVVGVNLSR